MIAFDNGPADGDYVRYIDALVRGSVSTSATTLGSNAAMPIVATDGRLAGDASLDARGLDAMTTRPASIRTAAGTKAAETRTAAANATMKRAGSTAMGGGAAIVRAALTMIAGLFLAVLGTLLHPFNMLMIVAGVAIGVAGFLGASRSAAAVLRAKQASR